jgi:hypothetical protein
MKASEGQDELNRNDKRFPPSYPTAKPELQLWGSFLESLAPLHATHRSEAASSCGRARE